MRRKFLTLLIGLMMLLSLNSCDVYTYATTQDDIYVEAQADVVRSNVDFNIVIQYGTPYYYNGSILYYIYKDLYYYPFYYNNYWYVRAYRRPFNHLKYRPYFRPHRYDYRFDPGLHRGFDRPNVNRPNNRFHNRRPSVIPSKPHLNNGRPNVIPNRPRLDNRSNQNNRNINRGANRTPNNFGHFGGSRK